MDSVDCIFIFQSHNYPTKTLVAHFYLFSGNTIDIFGFYL